MKIGLDKPVYIFILVFILLFSYTVLTHYPPEQPTNIDHIDFEPIVKYDDNNDKVITDNGTVLKPVSVKAIR